MRQTGHLPTYVAIPLATGGFFFYPVMVPLLQLFNTTPAAAVAVAVVWIALYVLMHFRDGLEQFVPFAAAFLTMISAGIAAGAYAADLLMTELQLRLLIVGTVMGVLAAINMTLVLSRRRSNAEPKQG